MKPVRRGRSNPDLFRERLDAIIDRRHGLVRLAGLMPWSGFDESFGKFYKPTGRPAKPTWLMVGLHYLKHVYNLSDEEVVERWVENPYHQYFCSFEFFQHAMPIDPSLMTRWRKRVGPEVLEEVLKATVDTTVQPKAIAHPTAERGTTVVFSRLYLKALLTLVDQAKKAGIKLRQSHTRLSKGAAVKVGRYAHAKQFKHMRRELKRLKTYLGRVFRDVCPRRSCQSGSTLCKASRFDRTLVGSEAKRQQQTLRIACA